MSPYTVAVLVLAGESLALLAVTLPGICHDIRQRALEISGTVQPGESPGNHPVTRATPGRATRVNTREGSTWERV